MGNLAATGIWSSDHPAHGELLCNEAILRPISIKKIIKKRIKWTLNQNVSEIFSPYEFLCTLFSPMLIYEHFYKFRTFLACMFLYYFMIFSLIFLPTVLYFDFLVMMLCGTHIYLGSWFYKPVRYSVDEFIFKMLLV